MLKLLEEDEVFRYAVAGKLGILEVLKKLDGIERNIERLWQEVKEFRHLARLPILRRRRLIDSKRC